MLGEMSCILSLGKLKSTETALIDFPSVSRMIETSKVSPILISPLISERRMFEANTLSGSALRAMTAISADIIIIFLFMERNIMEI